MHDFTVIIPARFGSSRFPGKPLALLAGEPMIQHVFRRAMESGASRVVIATDDARISEVSLSFGAEVVMTSGAHRSGTDRLAEAVARLHLPDTAVIVNLQGDEPLMPPGFIRQAAESLHQQIDADISTLSTALQSVAELHDPNVVKVVCNQRGRALFFSRAPIPWHRDQAGRPSGDLTGCLRHLGIYAYRAGFLGVYPDLVSPPLEQWESLEQLRAIWHGYSIAVTQVTGNAGPGVDTPADLDAVARLLSAKKSSGLL